jgi:cell division protein FtsB
MTIRVLGRETIRFRQGQAAQVAAGKAKDAEIERLKAEIAKLKDPQ